MSIERYAPGTVAIPTEAEEAYIGRLCQRYAASDMCPTRWKGKASELQVVADTVFQMGIPFTLRVLKQCYVIDNQLEIMAQLQVAIAAREGIDVVPDDNQWDDQRAVVHVTPPGKPRRTTTYTIDDARKNHLLDEWVEKWETAASGKKYARRFVVAVDGAAMDKPLPDWAKKELADGRVKRKEPWFSSRRDMLMARAVTRGLRYAGAHALLGLGGPDVDDLPATPSTRPVLVEDDITEAELVATPDTPGDGPAGKEDGQEQSSSRGAHEAGKAAGTTDNPPGTAADPASTSDDGDPLVDEAWVQRFTTACRDLADRHDDVDGNDLASAICYAVSGATVVDSAKLRRSQIRAVTDWYAAFRDGRAILRPRIGEPGSTLVELSDEQAPF